MPKTLVEVILVTADVYDLDTAIKHYDQEMRAGCYSPFLYVRHKDVRGKYMKTYCIVRGILNTDDGAFVESMKRLANKNKRSAAFIETVDVKALHRVIEGEIV